MAEFIDFVMNHLPPVPCRVLEVGCGKEGGVVFALVEAGYDAVGVDPNAPVGERFVQAPFQEVELGPFDAVVAGNVLHHVNPLGAGLDRLSHAAPLLLVDEFAWDLFGGAAQEWYEGQHRLLTAAGAEPRGPASLDEWRERHRDLHPHGLLLEELRARWEETALEWVPWLHRWLGGPASEGLEQTLVDADAFPAIGWRWAGSSRHAGAATG